MSIDNRKYVVFISSTYTDLMEERTSVTQAILESKHIPCCMEVFPATNESQWEYIKGEIKQSDYFIAIVGGKYGSIHPNTGQSYTEMEFRFARECGIPSLAFLIDEKIDLTKSKIEIDPEINRKLEVFRDYLKSERLCKFYSSKDDLKAKVTSSVSNMINRYPRSGWIRFDTFKEAYVPKERLLSVQKELDELKNSIEINKPVDEKINNTEVNLSVSTYTHEHAFTSEISLKLHVNKSFLNITNYFKHVIVLDTYRCKNKSKSPMISSGDQIIKEAWKLAYRSISYLNQVLEYLDENKNIIKNVDYYSATAKTLRALVYVDMIQHWGDVPFISTRSNNIEDMLIPRTDKRKIYASLLEDLKIASQSLSKDYVQRQGKLVPGVLADVLMGTIYLECNQDKEAATIFKQIIDTGFFKICKGQSIYKDANNSKENLFSLSIHSDSEEYFKPFDEIRKGRWHPLYRYTGLLLNYSEALFQLNDYDKAQNVIDNVKTQFGIELNSQQTDDLSIEIAYLWGEIIGCDYGYLPLLNRLSLEEYLPALPKDLLLLPLPMDELQLNNKLTQNTGY